MYYEAEGTNSRVRVLGSMHGFPRESDLPKWAWDAFDWSDDLFFEAPDADSDPEYGDILFLDGGKTLRHLMTPQLWQKVSAVIPGNEALNYQKPWVTFVGILSEICKPCDGVEKQFRRRLGTTPKPLAFLETPRMTAQAFETIPDKDYLQMLEFALDSSFKVKQSFLDSYDAWVAGRIDDLRRCIAQDPLTRFPGYRKGQIVARNRIWTPRIRGTFATSRKILFTVGAAHLFGEGGLENFFIKKKHRLIPLLP